MFCTIVGVRVNAEGEGILIDCRRSSLHHCKWERESSSVDTKPSSSCPGWGGSTRASVFFGDTRINKYYDGMGVDFYVDVAEVEGETWTLYFSSYDCIFE